MVLCAIALYFVIGCLVADGFHKALSDVKDVVVRLLRLACEVDPDLSMMVSIFCAFAALCWPAFFAAVIALEREEKRQQKKERNQRDVDVQR